MLRPKPILSTTLKVSSARRAGAGITLVVFRTVVVTCCTAPRTGKSTTSFVLASLLCLDIYTISLNAPSLDEDSLSKLFQDLPSGCFVLLEDVDRVGISKPSPQRVVESDMGPPDDYIRAWIALSGFLN